MECKIIAAVEAATFERVHLLIESSSSSYGLHSMKMYQMNVHATSERAFFSVSLPLLFVISHGELSPALNSFFKQ